jgi:mannose-6-phosphate isomerase-like protein (cupin superfamily)
VPRRQSDAGRVEAAIDRKNPSRDIARAVAVQEGMMRENSMKAIIHQKDAWEAWRPGVESRMLVSARNGAAQLCMFEQWIAPGGGAPTENQSLPPFFLSPPHSHPVEEVLTVREGEAEMWIDEQHMTIAAGQSLIVPSGRLHGFRNCGQSKLHIHAVLASPIFEAMMEGATEVTRRWNLR